MSRAAPVLGTSAASAILDRARALRHGGKWQDSVALVLTLGELCRTSPEAAFELGLSAAAAGDFAQAVAALEDCVRLAPHNVHAWTSLADALRMAGDEQKAARTAMMAVQASAGDEHLLRAAMALNREDLPEAESLLRQRLRIRPTDVAAIRMMGELAVRLGRLDDAVKLLARGGELAPEFDAARDLLARTLAKAQRHGEAVPHARKLAERLPHAHSYPMLLAASLVQTGEHGEALAIYEALLEQIPDHAQTWMGYGHVLKTVGRQADAVKAYRRAIACQPTLGEVYWSLANLKTWTFDEVDLQAMRDTLDAVTDDEDRLHLHFALGKALEDAGDYEASFGHYRAGNRLRAGQLDHDADAVHDQSGRADALFTPAFFATRAGSGCPAPDPIFIVGMPRAGSTLVEQILSSHSQVEGTMELPDMLSIAGKLKAGMGEGYPEGIAALDADQLGALGELYLERTRCQRKSDKPYFIDKMPNNWRHLGLIRLILPQARIIDARRHPLACCLSGFKQHFASGQSFSYDLTDIGRYYRDYVVSMDAIDRALPGHVHRVIYEEMIANTRREVERLLGYVGLPFEEGCLSYWQTKRAVRTASSEQVRQPIHTGGLESWRRFEHHLEPLVASLGDVLTAYPAAP